MEDLVSIESGSLKTFKSLPPEIVSSLSFAQPDYRRIDRLPSTGLYHCKNIFFHEHFNLLEFRDGNGNLLGHYSDIGTPLAKAQDGYVMTDWFLDIWLSPDGRLIELDLDEFEEAITQNLHATHEVNQARATFARLVEEVKSGIYPRAYLRKP